MALTEDIIRNAKPKEKAYKLSDEKALFLLVRPNGAKYWRLKYRYKGKENQLSFGVYPSVSLKDARLLRDNARKLFADSATRLPNDVDSSERRKAAKLTEKKMKTQDELLEAMRAITQEANESGFTFCAAIVSTGSLPEPITTIFCGESIKLLGLTEVIKANVLAINKSVRI